MPEPSDSLPQRPYVVVCRGPHCRENGGLPLRQRLVELLADDATVGLAGYACFGQCDEGPNVAFFPDGDWYGHLDDRDAAARVARHALGGPPPGDALRLPDEERTLHLRNMAELIQTLDADRARAARRRSGGRGRGDGSTVENPGLRAFAMKCNQLRQRLQRFLLPDQRRTRE